MKNIKILLESFPIAFLSFVLIFHNHIMPTLYLTTQGQYEKVEIKQVRLPECKEYLSSASFIVTPGNKKIKICVSLTKNLVIKNR